MRKSFSGHGFISSLVIHGALALFVLWLVTSSDDSANGNVADVVDTSISMEMMIATVIEEPEPTPQIKQPEPEIKEVVADPTVKPEQVKPEKQKEPEKKVEKPKDKPKDKPKKEVQKDLPKADKEVRSDSNINSMATSTAVVTTNNPNLAGSGHNTDEVSAYQNALRREIERHKRYPQRAKMMRKQGKVGITFNVAADGSISGARVVSSSGNEDLDNAALSAVQNAHSIGVRPVGMSPTLNVPINFQIQ